MCCELCFSVLLHKTSMCFSHHGVEAVGEVPSNAGRRSVFTAKLFDLLLGFMEHLDTLGIPVRQLVQLRRTHTHTHTLFK